MADSSVAKKNGPVIERYVPAAEWDLTIAVCTAAADQEPEYSDNRNRALFHLAEGDTVLIKDDKSDFVVPGSLYIGVNSSTAFDAACLVLQNSGQHPTRLEANVVPFGPPSCGEPGPYVVRLAFVGPGQAAEPYGQKQAMTLGVIHNPPY